MDYIATPIGEELTHYGVPGMKWGVRKAPERTGNGQRRSGMSDKTKNRIKFVAGTAGKVAIVGAVALGGSIVAKNPALRKSIRSIAKDTGFIVRGQAHMAASRAKHAVWKGRNIAASQKYKVKQDTLRTIRKVNAKRGAKVVSGHSKIGNQLFSPNAHWNYRTLEKGIGKIGNTSYQQVTGTTKYGRKFVARRVLS